MEKAYTRDEAVQRLLIFIDDYVFEYTQDLSGETLITTPPNYKIEDLLTAVTKFVREYVEPNVNRISDFSGKINYKLV